MRYAIVDRDCQGVTGPLIPDQLRGLSMGMILWG